MYSLRTTSRTCIMIINVTKMYNTVYISRIGYPYLGTLHRLPLSRNWVPPHRAGPPESAAIEKVSPCS